MKWSLPLDLMYQASGRVRLVLFVCTSFAAILTLLTYTSVTEKFSASDTAHFGGRQKGATNSPQSSCENGPKGSVELWEAAKARYRTLMEDKFTIVILTHQRPEELNTTLTTVLSTKIPSLLEIVVVWNNIDVTPPEPFTSDHGVTVRYRASSRNSLNEKILPDPTYRTQAILLSDDDVHYQPDDLEFVFRSWQKFGKNRMTGALARCHVESKEGGWQYSGCTKDSVYSMILTNLSFVHISFMDYYSSDDALMRKVRAYVDDHFNCEDIAMNFLVSQLTCEGPMQVFGKDRYFNAEPKQGISMKSGHIEARTQCLNDFTEMFGFMPLINQDARLVRGPFLSN